MGTNILPLRDLLAYWLKIEDNKVRFQLAESQGVFTKRDAKILPINRSYLLLANIRKLDSYWLKVNVLSLRGTQAKRCWVRIYYHGCEYTTITRSYLLLAENRREKSLIPIG